MRIAKVCLTAAALLALPVWAAAATINEIRTDQTGSDYDEYFELTGTPGESLNGLSYIVIGDGTTGSGTVECVVPLDGYSIAADGYFLMVESSYTTTCGDVPDAVNGTALNFENSDNVTHMLVSGFTGMTGDDLDTDDDGVLDATPWTGVVDSVALIATFDVPAAGEWYYSTTTLGPDGGFVPGHVGVCAGNWTVLDFELCTAVETPGEASDEFCGPVHDQTATFGALKAMFR